MAQGVHQVGEIARRVVREPRDLEVGVGLRDLAPGRVVPERGDLVQLVGVKDQPAGRIHEGFHPGVGVRPPGHAAQVVKDPAEGNPVGIDHVGGPVLHVQGEVHHPAEGVAQKHVISHL